MVRKAELAGWLVLSVTCRISKRVRRAELAGWLVLSVIRKGKYKGEKGGADAPTKPRSGFSVKPPESAF